MSDHPSVALPLTDAHMHFYAQGQQPDGAPFSVPEATVVGYRKLKQRLGIARTAVVQSMLYGTDNSVMLSALAELGKGVARGIAVTKADAMDALWDEMAGQGVVGLRAFMLQESVLRWSELPRLAERLAERGWQLHLQMNGRHLPEHAALLSSLRCALVIDHVGKFIPPVGLDDEAFRLLASLVESGRCWVKLSGFYETSAHGGPDYADVIGLARRLVRQAPERMIWASNWPHPNLRPAPDDALLIDLVASLAEDNRQRAMIMHENADHLFGFDIERLH
jgi:D-galactarolactone isomerase